MKKKNLIKPLLLAIAAVSLLNPMAMGQNNLKQLTLENLIPGGATYIFSENLYNLQWWGDLCIKPTIESLVAVDPKTGKETVLTTLEKVNAALPKNVGHFTSFYSSYITDAQKPYISFRLRNHLYLYDFKENKVISDKPIQKGADNIDISDKTLYIAYTIGNNLYVDGDTVTREKEGVVCGKTVHRSEFGIKKGTFWSPQGHLLAFYRMDESMVGQYPLVDTDAREGKVHMIRYPMAGMTSHKVTVGVYNPQTKNVVYLKAGDPTDRYFTNISWSPDEKSVYLIELNRDQNHSKLCRYNAQTGELEKVLIEETNPKYVEPQNPIVFLPWDDSKFIYQSERDGYNHLYLYNTDGKLLGQLTKGNWLVQGILGFNAKRKTLLIKGGVALNSNLYMVNVATKKCSKALSQVTEAIHNGLLSASGSYILDRYSTPVQANVINLIDLTTMKTVNLFRAKNPYEGYQLPKIEVGTIKAADGVTDLYYRLLKPANFDPNKKYPAIVYVYGGPHAQLIDNSFGNGVRGWDMYMANQGYIMFTLDNRGSDNRGLAFETATFRHLGIEECKDQTKGVEFLKSLGCVDSTRIGIHGWSFGGHMTVGMMLRHPDMFKAGVAGGPVIDWKYYEVMYGERYMDTPQTNPEGYNECNLKNYAGNLKGHLLIIHDDHDDTCVPQHSITFLKACIDAGTYPDFFTYPGHAHNVMGKDRVHLYTKITRYFEDNL